MQATEGVTEAWSLAEHSSFSGGDSGVHGPDLEIQNIFRRSMIFIDEGTVYGFDRARSGATPVYYSPDRSSVLKLSRSASTERLSKMEQAKALCQEMNLTHITIPSACAYKEFLVEQCVPLATDISSPAQIRLYLLNKEKFAKAGAGVGAGVGATATTGAACTIPCKSSTKFGAAGTSATTGNCKGSG
mgnify:CR=1 FL=1